MTTARDTSTTDRDPELSGQTVVVIGDSSGIGLEIARRARAEGASGCRAELEVQCRRC